MILYNVTLNIDESIHDEWLKWMKKEHLPEVMETGKFVSFGFYKIQNHEPEDESINYCVQYYANTMNEYKEYIEKDAPALKLKTVEKYGEKVLAFRTVLEKVT